MKEIEFVFLTEPKPIQSVRFCRFGEHVRTYQPKSNIEWKNFIRLSASKQIPENWEPLEGAIGIKVDFVFSPLRSFSKKTTENVQYICMENIRSSGGIRSNVVCISLGESTDVDLYDSLVTWQTKGSYNGQPINAGEYENDAGTMSLFRSDSTQRDYGQLALYSLILFDRTLTDAEIDWVKANLVAPPGKDYLRLSDGILLKDGSPLLLKDGAPLALKRIENTD